MSDILAVNLGVSDLGIFVAVALLTVLTAILALSETSLVRMSKSRAKALIEQGHHGAKALSKLVEDPESFLAPVLLLVLVCQTISATLVGIEADRLFGALGVVLGIVFEIVVIFVFAEAVPKQWALLYADNAALLSAPIITVVIGFPPVRIISSVLNGFSKIVIKLVIPESSRVDSPDVTESELLALADYAVEEDVLEDEERDLITSIIEFGDTIVREVMVPRPDVIAIEDDMLATAALEYAIESGRSRFPVFSKSMDDVIGIAYTRDLVHAMRDRDETLTVAKLSRPARFVPETKRVAPLLREMQSEHFHLAIVVDEYGSTAGVVTLEDLIEELVGDIADEFDKDEPLIVPIGEGQYRVSGKMPIDELNEILDPQFPDGDWDTVGGFVLHLKGQIPAEGEVLETPGYELIPERVQRRRIALVRIVKVATPEDENADEDEDE